MGVYLVKLIKSLMKINLLVVALFVSAVGCRKEIDKISFTTGTSPLNSVDNISFTKDNGLIISGLSGDKYTLIKTDAKLDIQWIKNDFDWGSIVRGSGWGAYSYGIKIVKVFQREDGDYVCIGAISEGGDVVFSSALIIIINQNGKQVQEYKFDNIRISDALKTDNGYVLFGTELIQLDNNFNKLWSKTIYNNASYFPAAIAATTDGGFAITGSDNYEQVYLQKLDENGNTLFTKTYKHNDFPFEEGGFDITQLVDAGFLIVGRTGEAIDQSNIINCQMIRTNSQGDTLWTKRFGYPTDSWIDRIVSKSQNEVVLQGKISFPTGSDQNTTLYKINSAGEILNSKITDKFLLIVYSPANGYIKAEGNGSGGIKLSVIEADNLFN